MRQKGEEVLEALKKHAVGRGRAVRANQLAPKIGLPNKVVSNALFSLAVEGKHPQVKREKLSGKAWFEYWVEL
jgi:hypothetical protein